MNDYDELLNRMERSMEEAVRSQRAEMVMKEYVRDGELANDLARKQAAWLRFLVLTASILFGILASLGSPSSMRIQTRIPYTVGGAALALGILCLSVCLYGQIYHLRRGRRLHAEETRKAFRESRFPKDTRVRPAKFFVWLEVSGYICFVSALLALAAYMLLSAFL